MKQLAYALPIVALACSPALAQQYPEYRTGTDTSAAVAVQIPPYDPTRGPRAGAWETVLAGSGMSTDEFDNNLSVSPAASATTSPRGCPSASGRTSISTSARTSRDDFIGITRAFIDFQAPLGRLPAVHWRLSLAVSMEKDRRRLVFGPEAGFKFWANESTFMFVQGEWLVIEGESFDNANVVYTTGFGLNF